MSTIKILLVEDDPVYIRTFKMYLDVAGYSLAGHTTRGEEVLNLVAATQPDLVLLDIQLEGEKTGTEIAKLLNSIHPLPVIFITALTQEPVFKEAMESDPYAYLVKPFSQENLHSAIELAVGKFYENDSRSASMQHKQLPPQQLFIRHDGMLTKIKLEEIEYVEVQDKESLVYLTEQEPMLVKHSLRSFKERLPSDQFFQSHRSYLVNIQKITQFDTANQHLILSKAKVPITQPARKELLKLIPQLF